MTRDCAEKVVSMLMDAGDTVTATLSVVKADVFETEYERYKRAAGEIMFALDGVLRGISAEYPDLRRRIEGR